MNKSDSGGRWWKLCLLIVAACLVVQFFYASRHRADVVVAETDSRQSGYVLCTDNGRYGRLGNYMFKYASTLGIAHSQNYTPAVVSTHNLLLENFNITSKLLDQAQWAHWHTFRERCASCYDRRVRLLSGRQNQHLVGFFQSWKYFADPDVQRVIRREFQFKDDIFQEAKAFIAYVTEQYYGRLRNLGKSEGHLPKAGNVTAKDRIQPILVGIHVRRGDLLSSSNQNRGYRVAPASYVKKAMTYLQQKYPGDELIFIVCTDTKKWVKAELMNDSLPVYVSEGRRPAVDMAILSLCSDVILTVGSFGWWSAWLSGGRTIYWKDYPKPGSTIAGGFNAKDYYPPEWIPMAG